MPTRTLVPLMGGHNNKRDPGMIGIDQLVKSQGAEYRLGDPEIIHRIPGRSIYGTVGSVQRVQGLVLATYDDATTFLLAVGGQQIWYSDASNGTTGTFTNVSLPGGARSALTERVSAAHFNNRWYVATGKDSNVIVEADATVVNHGMYAPHAGALVAEAQAAGVVDHYLQVTTNSGTWQNTASAGSVYTGSAYESQGFAGFTMIDQGDEGDITFGVTITNSFTARTIEISHYLGSNDPAFFFHNPKDDSDAFGLQENWRARLTISVATDGGTTFTDYTALNYNFNNGRIEQFQIPIADGVTTEDIRIKLHVSSVIQVGLTELSYRVYSVRLSDGSYVQTVTNTDGALFYAITEYDAERNWDSALSPPAEVPLGALFGSVKVTIPSTARSLNATHFHIWRTSNNNAKLVESELGLVGTLKVGETQWIDQFTQWGADEIPTSPLYEFLILDEYGEKSYYDLNNAPPAMDFIGNFKGAMFGLKNRAYYQSVAGRPNQWPEIFTIGRMPFKENSALIAGHQIGDVLWIGSEAGCILLDFPIETRQGSLRLPAPRKLEGAPGLVGAYAATPLSFRGESLVAWVSNHGVYISNLATFERVSDDIDWESVVTESSLDDSVLFWREKTQQLVLLYDSDGDGFNDNYMLIHMGDEQRTPTGRPLVTLGHPGNFAHWTGGRIGGVWKEFTCDAESNQVYLEGGADTDDSQSHNTASEIPFDVQTGRQYLAEAVAVGRAALFHSGVGTTVSLSVSYDTGRDGEESNHTADLLLALSSTRSKWTDFNITQAGDFMQWRFRHTGTTPFSLGPVAVFLDGADEQGLIE